MDNDTLDLGDLIGDDTITGEIAKDEEIEATVGDSIAESVAEQTEDSAEETITKTEAVAEEIGGVDLQEVSDDEDNEGVFLDSNVQTQKATTQKAKEEDIPPGPKPVTISSYLTTHKDKISNAENIQLKFKNIPAGKYMLFITEEDDGQLFVVDHPNTFYVREFDPANVIIQKSGIIIKGETYRAYVGKTNTHQFELDDSGAPVSMTVLKRSTGNTPKITVTGRPEEEMDLDEVKLHIQKESSRLYDLIKEDTDRETIRQKTLAFMDDIVDILHLIKIDQSILMGCSL